MRTFPFTRPVAAAAAVAAVAFAALVLAPVALAQDEKYFDSETAPRAAEAAEMARVRPLIEQEKLRPRIAGTWKVEHDLPAVLTGDGQLPPMTAASRRLYDQRIADRKAGKSNDPV